MSGNGYLFPLTLPDLVRRAQTHPKLAAIADVCRQMWPVTDSPAGVPLWWRFPSRLDAVFDWFGSVNESG